MKRRAEDLDLIHEGQMNLSTMKTRAEGLDLIYKGQILIDEGFELLNRAQRAEESAYDN